MRIIDICEREPRLFSRSELVDSGGRSLILPATRNLSAVDIRDVVGGLQLRTTGLIGFLPLTRAIALNIRPKFPLANLWYMLNRADETYDRILPIVRRYEISDEKAPHQLLTRAFCYYLSEIISSGLVKLYPERERCGFYQPKIDFGRSIARYLSRGDEINCVSSFFDFSADIPLNRLLKSACIQFRRIVPNDERWKRERYILDDALLSLRALKAETLSAGNTHSVDSAPMRVRDACNGAISCYSILSGLSKIGFAYEVSGHSMPSFLFCLDNVFENFVRNAARDSFRSDGISVVDGNKPRHHGTLFADNRKYPTKPDLAFKEREKLLALGEVKYKPKLSESDRYQLIAHTISAGAKLGIWISPAISEIADGLEYVGTVQTGAKFYHYRLHLGGSLAIAVTALTDTLRQLVGQQRPSSS